MTTYAASISPTALSTSLSISPSSTFQVRIARVEFNGNNNGLLGSGTIIFITYSLGAYTSSTLSGGTIVTPLAMRSGAPAALATVKSGATATGTFSTLHLETNSAVNSDPSTAAYELVQLNSTYTPAFDLILSAGSVFTVGAATNIAANTLNIVVYFEELRLAWTG